MTASGKRNPHRTRGPRRPRRGLHDRVRPRALPGLCRWVTSRTDAGRPMTPSLTIPTTHPAPDTRPWLERWLETCGDLAALKHSHPMMDAVIDEQQGRMIRIGEHWLADFASCNYLGLDLDQEIIDAIPG